MSKHTPGKWHRLIGEADHGHPIYKPGRVVVRIVQERASGQADFVRVALVDSDRPLDDARLIAAAPEMLDELQTTRSLLVRLHDGCSVLTSEAITLLGAEIDRIDAAIAKARGS
jgi:hypothetical protein